jgi:spermidine synthase
LSHPHARIVINDARNHLLQTSDRYDLILVDGSPPLYASGMVNLYSADFARMARDHLTERGVFALWFPVVCFEEEFWMVVRSLGETFPSIELLTQPESGNAILLGAPEEGRFSNVSRQDLEQRLHRWQRTSWLDADALQQSRIMSQPELRSRARMQPAVTDDRPYTEFPFLRFLQGRQYYRDNRFLFQSRVGP